MNTDMIAQQMGFESAEEIGSRLWKEIKKDKDHIAAWRKEAKENYAFEASDQWSDEDRAILEEHGRPEVAFNRITRTINAVAGLEIQNRQEVRYIPREMGDVGVNEVMTSTAQWMRDLCDAEDEESDSFRDELICGMGWTETRMDYETDPDGVTIIDRVDPLEMGWDRSAKKKNLDDSRRVWRAKEFTKEEVKQRWPDAEIAKDDFWGDIESTEHDASEAWKYENDQSENSDTPIYVIQVQWYELKTVYRVLVGQRIVNFDQKRWEKVGEYIQSQGMRYQKHQYRVYYQAFLNGDKPLELGPCPCEDNFTLRCMTGVRDRNRGYWTGLVGLMKDPQRWANKWLSQIMYILNTNSKGGLLFESGAFANPRKAEDDWSSPDSLIELNQGGLAKIQERKMGDYPQGIDRLLQHAMDSINDVPGVSGEFMGIAERFQSGYVEAQRRQAGISMLAPYFDGLRRYRKEQGRILAYFMREYMADGRLVRVNGQQGMQYIPLVKDAMTLKYDVIIDDAPTSPNMKERVFGILMEMLPLAIQAGIPVPPEVIDYAPLPETLTQSWRKMLNQPDPMKQQAQKLALEKQAIDNQDKVQEISESRSKEALNYAKVQEAGGKLVIDADKNAVEREKTTVTAFKTAADIANPNRGNL